MIGNRFGGTMRRSAGIVAAIAAAALGLGARQPTPHGDRLHRAFTTLGLGTTPRSRRNNGMVAKGLRKNGTRRWRDNSIFRGYGWKSEEQLHRDKLYAERLAVQAEAKRRDREITF